MKPEEVQIIEIYQKQGFPIDAELFCYARSTVALQAGDMPFV